MRLGVGICLENNDNLNVLYLLVCSNFVGIRVKVFFILCLNIEFRYGIEWFC